MGAIAPLLATYIALNASKSIGYSSMPDSPNGGLVDALADNIKNQSRAILDYIGITINMAEIPEYMEYAELRDRLAEMHPIRRWLSFRLRDKEQRLWRIAQGAVLNAVLEKGKR